MQNSHEASAGMPGREPSRTSPRVSSGEPDHYNNRDAALKTAWVSLKTGASNRQSPFHTPTVATIRADGFPSIRTVVLRSVDETARQIAFHTDVRSRKFAELEHNPRFAAHFYDPFAKLQLRLDCLAALDRENEMSRSAWERSRPMSRECYGQSVPPSQPVQNPCDAEEGWMSEGRAFENFAVVSGRIVSMDWLYLAATGHRRAIFDWSAGDLRQYWVAP